MRWIVVDGIDGSGKTTHALWMKEHYEALGASVTVFIHPSGRVLGRISRRSLQGSGRAMQTMAAIFFMLDVLNSLRLMRKSGSDVVIFVRYLMATAYLPGRLARLGYRFFAKVLPMPENLLLIDIDPKVAFQRIARRQDAREMFEDLPQLERIREKVIGLADGSWRITDNSSSDAESRERLRAILAQWDSGGPGPSP